MNNYINNISPNRPLSKQITRKFPNFIENFLAIILILFIVLLIINPTKYTKSVLAGSNLFYFSVMPSLLPFFFISKIIFSFNITHKIVKALQKPFAKIFKLPAISGFIFFMSILCGYPVGAKLIGELYASNQISESDAKKILTIASTSGPIFIIGSVGAGLFENPKLGVYIFIVHILSTLISGLILTRRFPKIKTQTQLNFTQGESQNILSETVYSTIISIFTVAVYISVFYMFIDMLYDLKILGGLSIILEKILSIFNFPQGVSKSISSGIVEMTRGLFELKSLENLKLKLVISSALISFGGISVFIQSMTFLSKTKINALYLLKIKCVQTIVSIIISVILGSFVY